MHPLLEAPGERAPARRPLAMVGLTILLVTVTTLSTAALTVGCATPGARAGSGHCYTFRVVHENCKVGQAVNWGCAGGREYTWKARCLGWIDAYHSGPITKCFRDPLEDKGSCSETKSLPPGGRIP